MPFSMHQHIYVLCPNLWTRFLRKQAKYARFQWVKTIVSGLFSRKLGLKIRALYSSHYLRSLWHGFFAWTFYTYNYASNRYINLLSLPKADVYKNPENSVWHDTQYLQQHRHFGKFPVIMQKDGMQKGGGGAQRQYFSVNALLSLSK